MFTIIIEAFKTFAFCHWEKKNRRIWGNQLLWIHLEVKLKLCFSLPVAKSDFKKSQGF